MSPPMRRPCTSAGDATSNYRHEAAVTESQDIDAWEVRYHENESATKPNVAKRNTCAARSAPEAVVIIENIEVNIS